MITARDIDETMKTTGLDWHNAYFLLLKRREVETFGQK